MNDASAVITREPADPKALYQSIETAVERRRESIIGTLPATIDPERFINVALQAVTRSPRLLECSPASIIKALRDAAELGLEPSGLMGSAYLVPYRNSRTRQYEAQLIPGYRGLIDLARRSAGLRTMEANVVRERDMFDYLFGTEQYLRHRPYINVTGEREPDTVNDRGEQVRGRLMDGGAYIAAYAFARLATGEVQFVVMSVPEVEAIRSRSKAADSGPWVTDWAAMAMKTPTRRLLKYLPLSASDLTRALELEDMAEGQSIKVSAPAPARQALAASLGIGEHHPDPDDDPDPTDSEGLSDPAHEPDTDDIESAEPVGPPPGMDGTCSHDNPDYPDVRCLRSPGHTGSHADNKKVSDSDFVWPA